MAEKRQMNLYLDEDLIKKVKHAAIEAEQRLSDFVAEALEHHLTLSDEQGEEQS